MGEEETLVFSCPSCSKKFKIASAKIPDKGGKIVCTGCKSSIPIKKPEPKVPDIPCSVCGLPATINLDSNEPICERCQEVKLERAARFEVDVGQGPSGEISSPGLDLRKSGDKDVSFEGFDSSEIVSDAYSTKSTPKDIGDTTQPIAPKAASEPAAKTRPSPQVQKRSAPEPSFSPDAADSPPTPEPSFAPDSHATSDDILTSNDATPRMGIPRREPMPDDPVDKPDDFHAPLRPDDLSGLSDPHAAPAPSKPEVDEKAREAMAKLKEQTEQAQKGPAPKTANKVSLLILVLIMLVLVIFYFLIYTGKMKIGKTTSPVRAVAKFEQTYHANALVIMETELIKNKMRGGCR